MKKILVALLILSVMGGVFAQEGSWSIGGYLELGATIDFTGGSSSAGDTGAGAGWIINPKHPAGGGDEDPNTTPMYIKDPAYTPTPGTGPVGAVYINDPVIKPFNDSWWANHNRARIGIDYNKGDLNVGLGYETDEQDGNKINGSLRYNGENYGFNFQVALRDVLMGPRYNTETGKTGTDNSLGIDVGEASGFYNFLDGKIYVKANGAGGWDQWWMADTSYRVMEDNGFAPSYYGGNGDIFAILNNQDLGVNFKLMDGLEFGVIFNGIGVEKEGKLFDVKTVFGAKYAKDALSAALQFDVESTGLYLGVGYAVGDLSFGVSLRTHFSSLDKYKVAVASSPNTKGDAFTGKEKVSYVPLGLGLGVNYNAGALSAGLKVGFGFEPELSAKDAADDTKTATREAYQKITIAPSVSYNVLPDSLQAGLEAVFKISTAKRYDPFFEPTAAEIAAGTRKIIDTPIYFHAKPYITFNFKNTGAGDWSTGIKVSYKVGSSGAYVITDGKYATGALYGTPGNYKPFKTGIDINELNITFRWSM